VINADETLDCAGTFCPIPIARTAQAIKRLEIGQVLEVVATDEGIKADMPAWCRATGNEFLGLEEVNGEYRAFVRRLK
jgi:tRNA 2-thiouridine synthesizing protein A